MQISQIHPASTVVKKHNNSTVGLIAVMLACISSGVAGVYFEKLLKMKANAGVAPPPSLWMRNIQLALFSILLGLIPIISSDRAAIISDGFLQGYNLWTWVSILLGALGGLLVAVVVKYTDNIVKVHQ